MLAGFFVLTLHGQSAAGNLCGTSEADQVLSKTIPSPQTLPRSIVWRPHSMVSDWVSDCGRHSWRLPLHGTSI